MGRSWSDHFEGWSTTSAGTPRQPGLYRLRFPSGAIYIGEAGDINRRVGDYVLYYPSTGIESEFRINRRLLIEAGAEVDVITGEEFTTRSARCVREHEEVRNARSNGEKVINGGTLRDRIAFHQSEIERLQARLMRDEFHGQDLDELMHAELLQNVQANAAADEAACVQARKLGFSEEEIKSLFTESQQED